MNVLILTGHPATSHFEVWEEEKLMAKIQSAVGGEFELIASPTGKKIEVYGNELGRILNLPRNQAVRYIFGDECFGPAVVVMRDNESLDLVEDNFENGYLGGIARGMFDSDSDSAAETD